MNYLISAYSINPYHGSEDGVGWNWVLQYEKHYKPGDRIVVLTKRFNEEATRRGFAEHGIVHTQLEIVDVPMWLNWFREKHSMFHHMYYILWQHWAWLWVKKSGIKFDVIHHVTMNDYRIPSQMHKVKEAKVIWGPVGGAQVTPKVLRCYETNRLAAAFREAVNKSCSWNPVYRRTVCAYDKIYCINHETKRQLESITRRELELLPELALKKDFENLTIDRCGGDIFKIIFVGRLIGKKGIAFLVDALSYMPKEFRWELLIYGDGEERERITQTIRQSQNSANIKLMGSLPFDQITQAYKQADVFVLPSLRETSGNVLLEAMAHAVPVVGFDTSFCSQLKTVNCGIFVNPELPLEKLKQAFCAAILELAKDKEKAEQLGINGYRYVNTELTWEKKYDHIYEQ